ncbi:LRR receptor-like serine/threonine-protein kinase FLS2 [Dendrobium catenatum]|uniref:LRR receptor-like serine/threonine-protein kinase FLS2 n=1 Tax=Dendrobium catenatum TaxID=906689 RepID=UPI0009F34B7B|nr:LRR receptor-like serine/threonine-protein kinase FLS2 [Dendrobium catenatum]
MAPEFAYMRRVTTKVDVFSFGIVMMEFFTRKRPTRITEEDGVPLTLNQFVEKALDDGFYTALSIIDPEIYLSGKVEEEKAIRVLQLALSCTKFTVEDRPTMKEVLSSLLKLTDV